MNNQVSAYTPNILGQEIDGKITFTFSNSALLDERLNEAYLFIVDSSTPSFEPTTEIEVRVNNFNGTTTERKSYHYIVSSDRSTELPNGSGKYKHEIHLLERTKLLEGIYCSSLTFTNSKGNTYTESAGYAPPQITDGEAFVKASAKEIISKFFKAVVPNTYEAISLRVMADYVGSAYIVGTYDSYEIKSGMLTIATPTELLYQSDDITSIDKVSITSPTQTNSAVYVFTIDYASPRDDSMQVRYEIRYDYTSATNRYPLKPWTITGCVNRCLDLAEPIFEGETPRYTFNAEQATKYDSVYAPEFSMTQCTLREQLKLIGSFIHAEPRLTENNEIVFDEYGESTEATVANKPYIYKGLSHDINEYCTHIDTSASNIVNDLDYAQGVVTEPNINNYRTLRTDSTNVILSESNSFAPTDNAIYDIPNEKGGVLVTLYDGALNAPIFENVDITPYIFTETEYNNLSSFDEPFPYSKHYALYYTKGQKGIHGLFYKVENAVDQIFSKYAIVNILKSVTGVDYATEIANGFTMLAFKITYVPIYDTKFSHSKQTVKLGKKPFSRIYNQTENLISTRSYGSNIKGVAQRMGNVEQTRTYILTSLDDIPSVAQTIDGYFIVDVKCEFQHGFVKCTVQMSKDFNRISQYVGINSNKRIYEVSEQNTYARDILLKNYVVVGDSTDSSISSNGAILQTLDPVMQVFNPSVAGAVNAPVNSVRAFGFSKSDTNKDTRIGDVSLPVISSAFGNAMVFSWDYADNYSAGSKTSLKSYTTNNNALKTATWQKEMPYGDYYGRLWWYNFKLYTNPSNKGYTQATTVEGKGAVDSSNISLDNSLLLRKDNREVLSVNYEIEFVTTHDDIVIGSGLASSCPLVSKKKLYAPMVVFLNRKVGKFERNLTTSEPGVVGFYTLNASMVSNGVITMPLSYEFAPSDFEFESWAIVTQPYNNTMKVEDEDGNVSTYNKAEGGEILIARNKSKAQYGNATTETIKFQIAKTIFDR